MLLDTRPLDLRLVCAATRDSTAVPVDGAMRVIEATVLWLVVLGSERAVLLGSEPVPLLVPVDAGCRAVIVLGLTLDVLVMIIFDRVSLLNVDRELLESDTVLLDPIELGSGVETGAEPTIVIIINISAGTTSVRARDRVSSTI